MRTCFFQFCAIVSTLSLAWSVAGCAPTVETPPVQIPVAKPSTEAPAASKPADLAKPSEPSPAVAKAVETPASEAAAHAANAQTEYRRMAPPDEKMFPGLKQIAPDCDVWFDAEKKRVVMKGGVCLRSGGVEMFACIHRWIDDATAPKGKLRRGTKEYESIVTINTSAAVVHSALLLTGAKPGSPVRFQPKYEPARGPEIDITLHWTDAGGKPQQAKAQEWIQNLRNKQAMSQTWVFAGSGFTGQETKQQQYLGENGDLICVANFTDAVLDLPIPSTSENESLMFEAFTDHIPPLGTEVTIVLTPK